MAGIAAALVITTACESGSRQPASASDSPGAAAPGEPDRLAAAARVASAATLQELMTETVDPAADAIWDAVAVIESADGVEERAPATDEEWQRIREHALTLVEAGHWLARPAIAGTVEGWRTSAQDLERAGLAALRASERRDTLALLDAGEEADRVCDACHNAYRSAPDVHTPAAPAERPR